MPRWYVRLVLCLPVRTETTVKDPQVEDRLVYTRSQIAMDRPVVPSRRYTDSPATV